MHIHVCMYLHTDTHTEPDFHEGAKGSDLSSQNQRNFSSTEIALTDEKTSKPGVLLIFLVFLYFE